MIYAFFPIMAAMFYGLAFAFTEKAMQMINVVTYMIVGSVVTIIMALGLTLVKDEPVKWDFLNNKEAFIPVIVAVIAPALGWFFTIYAIKNTSAVYAAFSEISYPLFTLLFLFLFFGIRHFDWTILAGGSLVMIGSFILVYGQSAQG